VTLSVAETHAFELFVPQAICGSARRRRFILHVAKRWRVRRYPSSSSLGPSTIGRRRQKCTDKIASWGNDGPPIELVIYPGAYHGFYYPHLQPGTMLFDQWLEYNGAAADYADQRLHALGNRPVNPVRQQAAPCEVVSVDEF
jgi:hypothetical protein